MVKRSLTELRDEMRAVARGERTATNASTIDAYADGYERARNGKPNLPPAHFTAASRRAWVEGFKGGQAELGAATHSPCHARLFVCQGCGKAGTVLHGSAIRCSCGSTSAAEVLP